MDNAPLIEPQNMPLWTAAGFIIAVISLALALYSVISHNRTTVATQAQILILAKKVEDIRKSAPASKPEAAAPGAAGSSK